MRRRLLLSVLAISAVFVTAGACAPASPPPAPTQPAQTVVPVKWIWTAVSGVSGGTWTAIDAGYFKEQGLNVEPVHIASSSRAVPALIANEAQFSNLDGNLLVQASLQGADVVGLLAQTNRLVFSVMADPSIAAGTDLKGKRLGITRTGSSTHTAALQALMLWKLEPETNVGHQRRKTGPLRRDPQSAADVSRGGLAGDLFPAGQGLHVAGGEHGQRAAAVR